MPPKTQSIILGGVAIGVVATLFSVIVNMVQGDAGAGGPMSAVLGCCACLVYVGAGLIAVWHYTNTYNLTIPAGQGVGMGALAGLVAALIAIALGLVLRAVGILPDVEDIIAQLEDSPQFDGMSDDQVEQALQMTRMMAGVGGYAIALVAGVLLGLIGGAIGAAIFKKGGDAPAAGI